MMKTIIDPKEFGLHPKTVIEQTAKDSFTIIVSRKSRIIMSDGKKLLEKVNKIRQHRPGMKVDLKTSAPVCSKTVKFLKEHKIDVIE